MSSSVSLYTMGNMAKAVIDNVTNEAAGFPKENFMDFNPDTYWKQSADAIHEFDIDFQTALTVEAAVLLIQNHIGNWGAIDAEFFSDDNAGFSTPTSHLNGKLQASSLTSQIGLYDFGASPSDRYWRLTVDLVGGTIVAPFLAGLFFCRKYTIAQAAQWPERDTESYQNRIVNAAGGRTFIQSINKNKQEVFQRTYQLLQADMTILQNAFNDSKGSLFPLILQEGSTNAEARLVRFADSTLNKNQIDYQLYRPTVTFITQPFISDGETY